MFSNDAYTCTAYLCIPITPSCCTYSTCMKLPVGQTPGAKENLEPEKHRERRLCIANPYLLGMHIALIMSGIRPDVTIRISGRICS